MPNLVEAIKKVKGTPKGFKAIPPVENYTPSNYMEPEATFSSLMRETEPVQNPTLMEKLAGFLKSPLDLKGVVQDYAGKLSNPDPSLADAASLFTQYAVPAGAVGAGAIALSDTSRVGGLGTVGGALAKGFQEAKAAGKAMGGKFHIPDESALLKGIPRILQEKRLSEVLEHPELYAQYPELKDVAVQGMLPTLNNAHKGGEFALADGRPIIRVKGGRPVEDQTSTLLHEIQHAIQNKEGWPLSEAEAHGVQKTFAERMQRMKS